ncbi:MAG: DUF2393 family protein [Edaphobacter sp.]|uniref:DUF2393 family protein n=1 Tax=Edaphobacter sp. TaxID=1934404 RepID=UPI00239EB77A|nr:DUF2393 family protein [Edaphobacter sp.]MDE1176615.1 DUF2393 family protein [Edaphobacter sp.]
MSASENSPEGTPGSPYQKPSVFTPQQEKPPGMPMAVWLVAGAVVLVLLGILIVAGHKKTEESKGVQPSAAYAASLPLSKLAMSESTSLSGGKSTFIDGVVSNTGSSTVTGITVQVLFKNDEQMPPQVETVPLMLIRTREPYVDTQTVAATSVRPGEEREFRLIFESIPSNWNMQMPEVHVIRVETK